MYFTLVAHFNSDHPHFKYPVATGDCGYHWAVWVRTVAELREHDTVEGTGEIRTRHGEGYKSGPGAESGIFIHEQIFTEGLYSYFGSLLSTFYMPGAGLQIHKFSNTVSDAEDPGPDSWGDRSLWHTLQQIMSRH